MAGGIDWFRWHHGSVTDQKFPLIAKRAGASVAEVIAVWACLLEAASQHSERGMLPDRPDFEAMDCALGLADGRALAIFEAMRQRNLLDEHLQVTAWPKRQPKREREDDNSTERVRAFRAKQHLETPGNTRERQPASKAAEERSETPRGEERRREEKREEASSLRSEEGDGAGAPSPASPAKPDGQGTIETPAPPPAPRGPRPRKRRTAEALPPPRPDDVTEQTWADWLRLRATKKADVSPTVVTRARAEAEKAGMPLEQFLQIWCLRGSQGLQAEWLKPEERGRAPPMAHSEPAWRTEQRRRTQQAAPGVAAQNPTDFFDVEARDVTTPALGG